MTMVSGPRFGLIQLKYAPEVQGAGRAVTFDLSQEEDKSLIPMLVDAEAMRRRPLAPEFTVSTFLGSLYVHDAKTPKPQFFPTYQAKQLAEAVLRKGVSFTEDPRQKQSIIKNIGQFIMLAGQSVD